MGEHDADVYPQLMLLNWTRELSAMAPLLQTLIEAPEIDRDPTTPDAYSGLAAMAALDAGEFDLVDRLLAARGARLFEDIPDEAAFPIAVAMWSEIVAQRGTSEMQRALIDVLTPIADVHGRTGGWYGGSYSRYLALLCDAVGDHDDADRWFAAAVEAHQRIGSPPWTARTRVDWAESALSRGDDQRARDLAHMAIGDVGDLELTVTRERATTVLSATS